MVDVDLDQGYYDRGIVARRDAHDHVEDITDILAGIEDEADKLLVDLLEIPTAPKVIDLRLVPTQCARLPLSPTACRPSIAMI
ncbi:hypothetical protein I1A62_01180 (plasmid) [Rhodococcus sp. USK10]|uniref:hypothetical protein n=1 Tax=Rhodococcus sp. USK10 TaxID=2789739 RepID=UPI001C5D447D|nr:hypothetical protein [Rhodococcus sp. USK10]QYA99811.1 hypothetical protein I1A62_01180 [Rhodococcus sp. USK10]